MITSLTLPLSPHATVRCHRIEPLSSRTLRKYLRRINPLPPPRRTLVQQLDNYRNRIQ
jgi:hypothetical protein